MLKPLYILALVFSLWDFSSHATTSQKILNDNPIETFFEENFENSLSQENDFKQLLVEKQEQLKLLQQSHCSSIEELQNSIYSEITAALKGQLNINCSINFTIIKTYLEEMTLNPSSKHYNEKMNKMFDDFYQKFYFVLPNPYQTKVLGIYEDVFVRMEERLEAEICILKDLAHTNP